MAFVDGVQVSFDEAAQRCADLINASQQPVFAHLGVDVAAVREAIRIAELAGGVLDHVASEFMLRNLDPLRETGGLTTTPMEACVRADLILLIGDIGNDPLLPFLMRPASPKPNPAERQVLFMDGGVGSLRALASLRLSLKREAADQSGLVKTLRDAKFGVAIWRAEDLPALAVDAVHGLVRDLNETTRFSTLALPPPDNGLGVQAVCGWMTGFPLRTGFGRGWPEHDPWRYDARRLISAGETDCVIWISALPGGVAPSVGVDILLDDGQVALAAAPHVRMVVSSLGMGGVMFDPRIGTLAASPLGSASAASAALRNIRARLEATQ